jgi:hypothetical protein
MTKARKLDEEQAAGSEQSADRGQRPVDNSHWPRTKRMDQKIASRVQGTVNHGKQVEGIEKHKRRKQ